MTLLLDQARTIIDSALGAEHTQPLAVVVLDAGALGIGADMPPLRAATRSDRMKVSLAREAAVSFVINAALSLAFFLAIFRDRGAQLSFAARDGLALDFLPQSVAVALMSALVPALVTRRRWVKAGLVDVPALRSLLLRAVGFAAGGALLGGLLAALSSGHSFLGWQAALWMKLLYGGLLGAMITTLVLRRMVQ